MPRKPPLKSALVRTGARHRREPPVTVAIGAAALEALSRPPVPRKPRKPKPENAIAPSSFRPHVRADERILFWSAPFIDSSRQSASKVLPEEITRLLFNVIIHSIEPGTRKNYGAGLLRYHQFCNRFRIPEASRMPASELVLAAFVSAWVGQVGSSTVDNWLAGLRFWHTAHAAPWHGDRLLKAACTTIGKLQPPPKPKRPPVTLEHMHALRSGLDLTNAFDAAVFALACSAFWGCRRRLGELLLQGPNEFDPARHVARQAGVRFNKIRGSGESYAVFHVPWTKSTKTLGADVVLVSNSDPSSPVPAMQHHLRSNASIPDHAPLFSFETSNGSWAPMTRAWFLERCNRVWKDAELEALTGHCFRIGGATELLLRGTHPDMVATLGSWKSRAFLEYWRKIESILPLFISSSFGQSRAQLASDTMRDFRKKHRLK
ncbi:DNA breaking-rejoining enzyme [Polyporus arcularius HHB13444]|uniref:DNA breaking-rejoining enzyme n=1 Tax=Polyporus arcularius HHB13444 TaxID=1314778 RepID=A0A5C3NK63_9APHY|nr:DNA breaking-rejoining enzyme [Polyporus arcularius HHB13444]